MNEQSAQNKRYGSTERMNIGKGREARLIQLILSKINPPRGCAYFDGCVKARW
jgi:hypothetical protein